MILLLGAMFGPGAIVSLLSNLTLYSIGGGLISFSISQFLKNQNKTSELHQKRNIWIIWILTLTALSIVTLLIFRIIQFRPLALSPSFKAKVKDLFSQFGAPEFLVCILSIGFISGVVTTSLRQKERNQKTNFETLTNIGKAMLLTVTGMILSWIMDIYNITSMLFFILFSLATFGLSIGFFTLRSYSDPRYIKSGPILNKFHRLAVYGVSPLLIILSFFHPILPGPLKMMNYSLPMFFPPLVVLGFLINTD